MNEKQPILDADGYYHFVYRTTNSINDKVYVGLHSTPNLQDGYIGSGIAFKRAVKKYGRLNFNFEVLSYCESREQAEALEEVLIKDHRNILGHDQVYNILDGKTYCGYGKDHPFYNLKGENHHWFGRKHSEETIQKMSEVKLGHKKSEEARKRMSESAKGKYISPETRRKISESTKGEKNHFYGKTHTEEAKQKVSEANTGRPCPEERKKYLSEAMKGEGNHMWGKTHSEETRRKISEANTGYKYSEEARKRMSERRRGGNSSTAKPVVFRGKYYSCMKDAALEHFPDVHVETGRNRVKAELKRIKQEFQIAGEVITADY